MSGETRLWRSLRHETGPYAMQIALLVLVIGVFATQTAAFRSGSAVTIVLDGFALVGLVCLGISVTMIAGELDLSAASLAAFSGVLAIRLGSLGLVPALLLTTGIAVVVGAVQGWVIARLKINSMVITIATLTLFQGAAYIAANEGPVALADPTITDALIAPVGTVLSPSSAIALVILALVGTYLALTKWGREMHAIGGARAEAVAAGVPRRRPLIQAFTISGGCAGLAGALASLQAASATPDAFKSLLLQGVTAALIGGISIYGGRGNVINVLLGVAILDALTGGLASLGVADYIAQLLLGVLLFTVIALEFATRHFRSRQHRHRLEQVAGRLGRHTTDVGNTDRTESVSIP